MRTSVAILAAFGLAVLAAAPPASAQKATEVYIPIGKPPGVSGKSSVVGRITAVRPADRTITVSGPSRTWTGTLDDKTRVYLDRSALRLPSKSGTKADCCEGAQVEMKYTGAPGESTTVEWIKVRVTR